MNLVNTILVVNNIKVHDYDEDIISLGISSIDFIQIVVAIEEQYFIELPDEYLIMSNMNNISKITEIVNLFVG